MNKTDEKSTSARKLEKANLKSPQTSQGQEGYRIVCIENIRKTVESMHKCKDGNIITSEDAAKRAGLSST